MFAPVLRRPALRRSIQLWRSGATGGATGISIGATSALPISPPPRAGAGAGATTGAGGGAKIGAGAAVGSGAGAATGAAVATGAGAGAGVAAGFFRKKLNIRKFLESHRFY